MRTGQPQRSFWLTAVMVTGTLVAACGQTPPANSDAPKAAQAPSPEAAADLPLASLGIINAKLRTPLADRPSAGYLTIENTGPKADSLLAITSPDFARVEMHDTVSEGGMKKMVKLDRVDLPAGSKVEFAPGGKHLMLFDPKKTLKNGDSVNMTLNFKMAGSMEANFVVLDQIPRAAAGHDDTMDHSTMDHSTMDHGSMDHGSMDHGSMGHESMNHGSKPR